MEKYTRPIVISSSSPVVKADKSGVSRLGTKKNFATTSPKGPSKWQLKRGAMKLLPGWSVNACMHETVEGVGTVNGIYVPATGSGVVTGVKRCKSATTCPVCCSHITEIRRKELAEGIAVWRSEAFNGRVVMATYTFRHDSRMPQKWMVERLNEAFRAMKKSAGYDRLLKRYGVKGLYGTVAAREVKFGKNGAHPHIHELLFIAGDADVKGLEQELRVRWEEAAAKVGLSMNSHGFKLDDCDEHVAQYVAKYDREPAWTETEEITKGHLKQSGEATRQVDGHYTPFQLLRFAMEGDEEAGLLFVEYAQAMKGKSLIRWKPGFREAIGLEKEKTDAGCIEEKQQQGELMVQLDAGAEWPIIVGNDAVGEFVEVLATGDMRKLCEFLEGFGIIRDSGESSVLVDLKDIWKKKKSKKVAA
jgi:hypothetical protein